MSNFIFALNATLPVFLVILLGWLLRCAGILNAAFCAAANQYVFIVALPVSLFSSISTMDLYTDFDPRFCVFCALATTVIFLGIWALTWRFLPDQTMVGAFAQAAARSSAAILGVAFAVNIYGGVGMVPMMIVAAVPLFNIYAVLILTFSPQTDDAGRLIPSRGKGGTAVRRACVNVVRNPIILGILGGIPFSLLHVTLPTIVTTTLNSVGITATPVALLVVGASFDGAAALRKWKPAALATFIKLFLLPALFLPLAAWMGFRDTEMVAILIMCGSPTTVSCYVMARNMHADHVLTADCVVLATLVSSVSLTLWIFLLRSMALI